VNYLIANSAKNINAECKHVFDAERYGSIARRQFDNVAFGLSISMMLFLIASVIAIAFYTVT
jgi:hypothetical protein